MPALQDLCCPGDHEGLSLALLDAMGAGLGVQTSHVPENREVVEGGWIHVPVREFRPASPIGCTC
jgi:glycosyltransferase involved in cell wall biosynthesis